MYVGNMADRIPEIGELLSLQGKRVLVTGAAKGIGFAITGRLLEAGAQVVAHYRSDTGGLSDLQVTAGDRLMLVKGNLDSVEHVQQVLDQLEGPELHGIVNNAADQHLGQLAEIEPEQWRAVMAVNLDAVFQICQWAQQHVGAGGSVVNISSIEGSDPAPAHGHYATSKAGMNMLTKAFALESGSQDLRFNSVAPGLIYREGIEEGWPEGVARWRDKAPLQRLGQGADIADAVLFLLGSASRWITGTQLVVDGGMSTQSRW